MRRLTVSLTIIILILGLLTGCSNNSQSPAQPQAGQQDQNNAQKTKTVYPLTITDDTGTTVTIPARPQRIVSLLPSSTEILCAIGQYPIAVTQWDDYPVDVKGKAEYVFQDALNPNPEQLVNLKPDLIMYWLTADEDIKKIRNLGVPVVVLEAKNIPEVYERITTAGKITDQQEQAAIVIEQMKAKEKSIEDKIAQITDEKKRKVWIEVDSNMYTAGSETFLDEVITRAGGVNIAKDVKGWTQFNNEQVIARNPDVIFETYSYMDPNAIMNIKNRKGWENIEAVKTNRVIGLENNIISRQGPRIIDGVELTAKAIYPELFNGK